MTKNSSTEIPQGRLALIFSTSFANPCGDRPGSTGLRHLSQFSSLQLLKRAKRPLRVFELRENSDRR